MEIGRHKGMPESIVCITSCILRCLYLVVSFAAYDSPQSLWCVGWQLVERIKWMSNIEQLKEVNSFINANVFYFNTLKKALNTK